MTQKKAVKPTAKKAVKPTEEKKPEVKVEEKPVEKVETKSPEVKPEEDKEKELQDFEDYKKFAEFHFLRWDGDLERFDDKKLKEETLRTYRKLESKFKDYDGHKPKYSKTIFLGIGLDYGKIVEGYGVPKTLYQMFVDTGKDEYYFEQ